MNAKQYRAALDQLELSQARAAQLFGLGERTGRRYALKESRIAEPVAILLRLMLAGKISAADIERVRS